MASHDNAELLAQLKKKGWTHVRKFAPVWAQKLTVATEVHTLEGVERAPAGHMLCRGVAGELWPQAEERLLAKYKPTGTHDGPWRKYVPDPKQKGFFASPAPHDFVLYTSYGVMHGKKGDYVLKNFADGSVEVPREVWVVDRKLFNRTYTKMITQTDVGAISAFLKLSGAGEAEQQNLPQA